MQQSFGHCSFWFALLASQSGHYQFPISDNIAAFVGHQAADAKLAIGPSLLATLASHLQSL